MGNFERPKDAVVDLKLEGKIISTDKDKAYVEKYAAQWKFHNLSNAEALAWAAFFQLHARRNLDALYNECSDVIDEGTEDEDTEINEVKYKEARLKISADANKLMYEHFDMDYTDIDDLFDYLGIVARCEVVA